MSGAFTARAVCDSIDREAWQIARAPGLGASDVASYAKDTSVEGYALAKLKSANAFRGNEYTERGHKYEPAALAAYGYEQNTMMYHAEGQPLHLATPDGIGRESTAGVRKLAQVKTKSKWNGKISPADRRQILWEQYVMGPEFRLTDYLVLPFGPDGRPTQMEPERLVIERDDDEIEVLVRRANLVLHLLTEARAFRTELTQ